MTWSRAKLEKVAGERLSRRAGLKAVERAALAFARWKGLTDESEVDTEAAKRALDKALADLDAQGPDGWHGLEQLGEELGDTALIGLMQYSLRRSVEQVREQAQVVEPDVASSGPRKKRGKERDR